MSVRNSGRMLTEGTPILLLGGVPAPLQLNLAGRPLESPFRVSLFFKKRI
jgi:hypothetical protein